LIKTTDKNFKNDGTYFVLVFNDGLNAEFEKATFTIKWNTGNTINILSDKLA